MWWEYVVFGLFTVACEIIGTVGGFGSSVIFVPLASFFLPRSLVLGLTSILHVFSNTSKIILFWKHIDKRLLLLFGVTSLLFTVIGAYLTVSLDIDSGKWIMGIFLILFSLLFILYPELIIPPTKLNAAVSGSMAGFAAGLIGTGGAIRGMAMAAFNLPKDLFVGTSAAIDFGVDLSRMFIYAGHGFMEEATWAYILVLFMASWIGTWIGKLLLLKIPQDLFKRIVLLLILTTGIATLLDVSGLFS
jgi:uncharacterized protein